jgi:putative Mg2+ transporter-C (MgtC) family protein
MPLALTWQDAALRLALTVAAGMLIGFNRNEHGKAAGMRTTVLVCLAASVAMLEVNALLGTAGRSPNSFVMNDLMRFPLGILTGVGFIGGGVILHRDNLVVGVTTAATLWLVTVIGLCLGAGLIAIGIAATALGLAALWALQWLEGLLLQQHRAEFSIQLAEDGLGEDEIRLALARAGISIVASDTRVDNLTKMRKFDFEVRRMGLVGRSEMPPVIAELGRAHGVAMLRWKE